MNRALEAIRRFRFKRLVVGVSILTLVAVVAYAAVIPTVLGVGDTQFSEMFQGPSRFTARHLITTPGDVGDWHSHPGYVFNVVVQGEILVEDGCGGIAAYGVGDAFEVMDGRVHRAINNGAVDAIEYNMFVNPSGTPLTVFTGALGNRPRRCGPPRNIEECTGQGWAMFDYPHAFPNQGACIAYVRHRPQVVLTVPEVAPF
jgi:quercetin dioxygenase-like cupin family protein